MRPLIGLRQQGILLGGLSAPQRAVLLGRPVGLQLPFQIRDLPLQLGRAPPFQGKLASETGDLPILLPLETGLLFGGVLIQ
jgi:hypothetical protein